MSNTRSRVCSPKLGCGKKATRGNRVCFSKRDREYLHGSCRVPNTRNRARRNDRTEKLWYALRNSHKPATSWKIIGEFFAKQRTRGGE